MRWIKQLFSRRRLYGELSEEIQEHLEGKIEELVASGMPRKEATYAARREFGNVALIEEGSLYPALQRLLKEELVKAEWSISSTNRRVRIYKLTAKGAKHLEQEVSRFEKMLEGITRVLAPGES